MRDSCNLFAANRIKDPNWAFSSIVKFFQFQRERVEKEEISGATLRNFVKAIKLFCQISDIPVTRKKSVVVYRKLGDMLMIALQS